MLNFLKEQTLITHLLIKMIHKQFKINKTESKQFLFYSILIY